MATNASICQNCLQTVPEGQEQEHQGQHLEATESAKGEEFQAMMGLAAQNGYGVSDNN